jgi:hypothetical protein
VCTGRQQHAEARITSFAEESGPDGGRRLIFQETPGWDVLAETGPSKGATYRFRCRRCRRDVQLSEQTLMAVIDALRAAGERLRLDISLC